MNITDYDEDDSDNDYDEDDSDNDYDEDDSDNDYDEVVLEGVVNFEVDADGKFTFDSCDKISKYKHPCENDET